MLSKAQKMSGKKGRVDTAQLAQLHRSWTDKQTYVQTDRQAYINKVYERIMCRLIGTDRPTDRQRGKQRDGRLSLCETRERYSDGRTSSEERIHHFTQFQTLAVPGALFFLWSYF